MPIPSAAKIVDEGCGHLRLDMIYVVESWGGGGGVRQWGA
jgi:hypothetical protein